MSHQLLHFQATGTTKFNCAATKLIALHSFAQLRQGSAHFLQCYRCAKIILRKITSSVYNYLHFDHSGSENKIKTKLYF